MSEPRLAWLRMVDNEGVLWYKGEEIRVQRASNSGHCLNLGAVTMLRAAKGTDLTFGNSICEPTKNIEIACAPWGH